MKNLFPIISIIIISLIFIISCQVEKNVNSNVTSTEIVEKEEIKLPYPDSLFQIFEMEEGDTTYRMKQYFMVFLKKGPNRDYPKEEAAKIQKAHLEHMGKLADSKHICLAGPFDGDGDIRGIVVYSVPTMEEAERLTQMDPAVKAGSLTIEIHPWWAAVGGELF